MNKFKLLKKLNSHRRRSADERGLAIIEAIPILILFVILFGYAYGLFGVIHSGTLHSIAARNYAFETFRNRADLTIFRVDGTPPGEHYSLVGARFHAVRNENYKGAAAEFIPSERPIAKGLGDRAPTGVGRSNKSYHNEYLFAQYDSMYANGSPTGVLRTRDKVEVAPVWLQIGYGICLNIRCGD